MLKIFVKIFSILILLLSFGNISAQEFDSSDSLVRALYTENDPQKKMDMLIELTDLTYPSDPDRALDYANQTLSLAYEHNNQKSKLGSWLHLGNIYWNKAVFRSSMEIWFVSGVFNPDHQAAILLGFRFEFFESATRRVA